MPYARIRRIYRWQSRNAQQYNIPDYLVLWGGDNNNVDYVIRMHCISMDIILLGTMEKTVAINNNFGFVFINNCSDFVVNYTQKGILSGFVCDWFSRFFCGVCSVNVLSESNMNQRISGNMVILHSSRIANSTYYSVYSDQSMSCRMYFFFPSIISYADSSMKSNSGIFNKWNLILDAEQESYTKLFNVNFLLLHLQ